MSSSFNCLFSREIYLAREERHYSQEYVASCIGISSREYQRYEKGAAQPRAETFLKLISLFNLDIQAYQELIDPSLAALSTP